MAGRAHLDGARVAAKDGLELEPERDGAPLDTAVARDGRLEDSEVAVDGLRVAALEDTPVDGPRLDPADGRAGKILLPLLRHNALCSANMEGDLANTHETAFV